MANAKRCDICGKYFDLPAPKGTLYKTLAGKVEMHKLAENIHHTSNPDKFLFDACDDCVQEIIDLILTKKAAWETKKEEEQL